MSFCLFVYVPNRPIWTPCVESAEMRSAQVDGMMVWLSSGENIVWAVSANGALWYRAGIEQACPMGTNWFRVDTANDKWVRDAYFLIPLN